MVMLNDDVTPMDFVVDILVEVFDREHAAAVELMLKVHHEGSAVVGSYPYDVARTKQRYCIERARSKGYPFELRLDRE